MVPFGQAIEAWAGVYFLLAAVVPPKIASLSSAVAPGGASFVAGFSLSAAKAAENQVIHGISCRPVFRRGNVGIDV